MRSVTNRIDELNEIKNRITHNGPHHNFLAAIINQQTRGISNGIKAASHQMEVLNLAEQITAEYTFEPDQLNNTYNPADFTGTSTTWTNW